MTAELQQDDAAGATDRHGSVGLAAAGADQGADSGSHGVGVRGPGWSRAGRGRAGLRRWGAGLRRAPGPGGGEGSAPAGVSTGAPGGS